MLSKNQAREIIYAHEIDAFFLSEEEIDVLKENNPKLLNAYVSLMFIAELGIERCGG